MSMAEPIQELPSSTPSPRRWLRFGIRIVVSLGVMGWLLSRLEWEAMREVAARAEPTGWLMALVLYGLVQMGLSSSRWQMLAEPLGFQSPWRRYFGLYYVGLFFNLFLPTSMGGDVVRAWSLADRADRRWPALLSVISDRLSGLLALVMLACLATIFDRGSLPPSILWTVWGLAGGMGAGLLLLPRLGRRFQSLARLAAALSVSQGHRRRWFMALGISLCVQSASVVQIALMGQSLGLQVPVMGYAVVVPLVSVLTLLPVSVGGIGVREGSLVLLLKPLGVTGAAALALGLAWFAMNFVMGMVGGLVYLFFGSSLSGPSANMQPGADASGASAPSAAAPPINGFLQENRRHGSVHRHSHQGRTRQSEAAA